MSSFIVTTSFFLSSPTKPLTKMFDRCLLIIAVTSFLPFSQAFAELENVEIGGSIETYAAWYSDFFEPQGEPDRIPPFWLLGRPIGNNGTSSYIRCGDSNNLSFWEQRIRLHTRAIFTRNVELFAEWDSTFSWGNNFPSNYLTGADFRANLDQNIELYQAYLVVSELWNSPFRIRVGRQELEFGSGWLVGADFGPDPFIGFSFDAIRLTYEQPSLTLDIWWSKLAESGPLEEDGDADFAGIYLTFLKTQEETRTFAFEWDLYWLFLRDGRAKSDTNLPAVFEWCEQLLGVDDYDPTALHTVGTRFSGILGAFDWEVEVARQFGEADAVGAMFIPIGKYYGDSKARYDKWAAHGELGYSFDILGSPRVYFGAAYYGGEDNRSISQREWLNPFSKGKASVSFNRLFSIWREDNFIDAGELSNFWKAYAGTTFTPTSRVEIDAEALYFEALEGFEAPLYATVGKWRIPIIPRIPIFTKRLETSLGWQTLLTVSYKYSEDLTLEIGWSHYWPGQGIFDGVVFADQNGTANIGGVAHDNADYVYVYTKLTF